MTDDEAVDLLCAAFSRAKIETDASPLAIAGALTAEIAHLVAVVAGSDEPTQDQRLAELFNAVKAGLVGTGLRRHIT